MATKLKPLSSIGAGICLFIYGVLMLGSSILLASSGAGGSFLVVVLVTGLFGILALVASVGLFNNAKWGKILGFAIPALSVTFSLIFAAATMAGSGIPFIGLAGLLHGMATAFAAWLILSSGAWAFK